MSTGINDTIRRNKCTGTARRILTALATVLICLIINLPANAGQAPDPASNGQSWEHLTSTGNSDDNDRIETVVRDGYIYITTSKVINVKIFSILGQLISSTRVPAGTSRLKVPARGIYILKAGPYTRRLTV